MRSTSESLQEAAEREGRFRRLMQSFGFRLNLWYTVVFTVSAAGLFFAVYWLLGVAIERKDRELLDARISELSAVYESDGVPGLRAYLGQNYNGPGQPSLLVEVRTPFNTRSVFTVPPEWITTNLLQIAPGLRLATSYARIPSTAERDFTLGGHTLSDRSRLVVGRITGSRESLLEPIRRLFLIVMAPIVILGFIGGAAFTERAI